MVTMAIGPISGRAEFSLTPTHQFMTESDALTSSVFTCAAGQRFFPDSVHATPLGPIFARWSDRGLYRLSWTRPEDATTIDFAGSDKTKSKSCRLDTGAPLEKPAAARHRPHESQLAEFLLAYFDGTVVSTPSIPLDPSGWTDFQQEVYRQCQMIPAGQTLSYGQLAALAGRPKASRAVGAAMARNRIVLLIPCHRVIAANGKLTGFSAPGGVKTKRFLLDLEQGKMPV